MARTDGARGGRQRVTGCAAGEIAEPREKTPRPKMIGRTETSDTTETLRSGRLTSRDLATRFGVLQRIF